MNNYTGKPVAKNKLSNCNVVEIANAGLPAVPAATFVVMKNVAIGDGQQPIMKTVRFYKDEAKKRVYGYVLVPDEPDLQGDVLTKEEVEKAMISYMKNGFFGAAKASGISGSHTDFDNMNHPIECAIDKDGALMKAYDHEDVAVDGAWWFGEQCDANTWEAVQKGEYTGFSIGGVGIRTPIEADAADEPGESMLDKAFAKVKSLVTKGEGDSMSFDEVDLMDRVNSELWKKLDQLAYSISTIVGDPEVGNKQAAIGASIDEFRASLLGALSIQKAAKVIAKAGKEISAKNRKLIADALTALEGLQGIMDRINEAEQAINKGDNTMAHTLESLGKGLETLTEKIDKKVMPVLSEFEEFKKAQKQAAAGDADGKPGDKPADDDGKPSELEKALDAAFEKNVKPLSDKIDAIDTRLKKVEGQPGKPAGDQQDQHDDARPAEPLTKEQREAVNKDKVQKVGRTMIFGPQMDAKPTE